MPKLTDETLMLYADGLLGSHEAEHVEKMLAQDNDLRSRLQIFKLTGRELGDLMQDHVNSAVPQRLLDSLTRTSPEPFGLSTLYQRIIRWPSVALEQLRVSGSWGLDAAMVMTAVALFAGLGLGWLLRGGETANMAGLDDLIRYEGSEFVAQGGLKQTLDNTPSDRPANVALSEQRQIGMGVAMTFRNEAGDYCRQYEVAGQASWNYTGVACRSDGDWLVKFQAITAPSEPATDGFVPASGGDRLAVDAAIGALVVGAPLTSEEEAAALSNGWKQ